jgi:heme-degrading monooxygenase HmoA
MFMLSLHSEDAMHAVIFEVLPSESGFQRYLDLAAYLRPQLEAIDGFLSVERFRSLRRDGWILSLSLWRDETALIHWRSHTEHHAAQATGRRSVFHDYRIRVARMGDPRACRAPLVGLSEIRDADAADTEASYESLTTPDKRIMLRAFDTTQGALGWQQQAGVNAMCGEVLRDYGLFERAQAPQQFPPMAQRIEDRINGDA